MSTDSFRTKVESLEPPLVPKLHHKNAQFLINLNNLIVAETNVWNFYLLALILRLALKPSA